MRRGDVRDSGHNRDMGDSAIAEIALPKKDRTSISKTAIRQGLYLHLYYIKREFVSSKNHLRTPKRGLIV
jgi:hypothetical protein